jgi:hypothetical protein
MNRVKFSADWDKLKDSRFTTIRSYRIEKEKFYRALVGQPFTILRVPHEFSHPSKGRKIGTATLRSVEVIVPSRMPAIELQRDVTIGGRPDQKWLDRLLSMDKALLLEFENHTGLMGSGIRA